MPTIANPINVGRSLFSKGNRMLRNVVPYRRQVYRHSKKNRRTPKLINIPRGSKGQQFFPRFNFAPIKSKHNCVLNYTSERKTLSGAIGGIVGAVHEWGLNCCFDPDLTGAGHQPMGFDQMAALWKTYRVWKVDFKIRAIAGTAFPFIAAQVNNSQVPSGTVTGQPYTTLNERTNCAVKIIEDPNDSVVYGSFMMSGIEGKSIFDDNYTATSSGNPGNKIKLVVGCGDAQDKNDASVEYYIELNFHVTFFNRVSLGQS